MKLSELKQIIRKEIIREMKSGRSLTESKKDLRNAIYSGYADELIEELEKYESKIPKRKFDEFVELAYEIEDAEMGMGSSDEAEAHQEYIEKELKKLRIL